MNRVQLEKFLETPVSLDKLELLVVDVPQHEIFKSAIGERRSRKALVIVWTNKNGIRGYGECSCRPDPFYSHEYVDGAVQVIKDFIYPLLTTAISYQEVLVILDKIRGWNFTKAAIESAMNDVIRRETGQGIIEASGLPQLDKVPVGVSLGLFDTTEGMEAKVAEAIEQKYQRLKFKISPDYTDDKILAILSEVKGNVSLDANGSFKKNNFKSLSQFADMGFIIEQPFPPTEMYLYKEYLKSYEEFRICLDEDIESYGNLISLHREMDEVNIKPGRVGGLYTSLKMITYCQEHDLDAWVGGMFETGIGRAQNLQIAALLHGAKAHDLSPSSRYFSRDVVEEPIVMDDGFINSKFFINIEPDIEALESMTVDKLVLKNV